MQIGKRTGAQVQGTYKDNLLWRKRDKDGQ